MLVFTSSFFYFNSIATYLKRKETIGGGEENKKPRAEYNTYSYILKASTHPYKT